ncbi:MAG TPA: 2-keto-4-pentenoate hydratase [Terriglobia bacterium]|jgi:hypothetical protein
MQQTRIEKAAEFLVRCRRDNLPQDGIPEGCRPENTDEALAVQQQVLALLGENTGGWKCSVPSGEKLTIAPLPASAICRTSPCSVHPKDSSVEIEPEIAFSLGRTLDPRPLPYSEEEVRAAIREIRLVLEVLGSRYRNPSAVSWPEALADSVRHQGMFIGPILQDGLQKPLEGFHLTIQSPAGPIFDRDVRHPNGHPLRALYWLVNFLSSRGQALPAGAIVTTGSYAGVIDAPMNTPLTLAYGALGTFTVEFRRA